MRARNYFVSNPCRNTSIRIYYAPCATISQQKHTTSFGFEIDCFAVYTDLSPYSYIDEQDKHLDVPCMIINDNRILIHVLETIEDAPDLPDSILKELVAKYHIGNIELTDGYTYIPISTLRQWLYNLYMLYICFRVLVWEVTLTDITSHIWKKRLLDFLDEQLPTIATFREICTTWLAEFVNCGIQCDVTFEINANGSLARQYECKTIDDALIYLLLLHIEAGKDGLNGFTLAKCKRCGKIYPQETRKYSLCEQCREPRERTKACRARKKVAQNAQESNP